MRNISLVLLLLSSVVASGAEQAVEQIGALAQPRSGVPILLKGSESISTKESFQPPVEITIEAKTDSTGLRIGYAADQVIFNWGDMKEIPSLYPV